MQIIRVRSPVIATVGYDTVARRMELTLKQGRTVYLLRYIRGYRSKASQGAKAVDSLRDFPIRHLRESNAL